LNLLYSNLRQSPIFLIAFVAAAGYALAGDYAAGVPNFHIVNDHVYRGAQPSAEGFKSLAKLGVKTVIDLRETGERWLAEPNLVEATGMRYLNIPMRGLNAPTSQDMSKVLALLNDSAAWPVFVHCRRGKDRTGTVIACYRIEHDRWNNEKALSEARSLGMSFVERAMAHYILGFEPELIQASGPSLETPTALR